MATTAASATLAAPGNCVVVWGGSSMSSSSRPSKNGVVLSSGLWGKGMASSLSKSSINAGLCHRRSRVVSRSRRSRIVLVRAAKLPSEVERPKEEPKLQASFWGFTEEAEVWNSRAAMIGIFCLIALEFVIHKGILQIAGVEVGKGLDLPL